MSGLFGWMRAALDFQWLVGLASGRFPWETLPGTHAARLEEKKLGALLTKELRKPPGQRDEELAHKLRLDYNCKQLENAAVN